jgi:hypothetical protein
MCIACNAPGFLWDEFYSTAAYLTCLTAATANNGRTPYKLWYGCTPSLSHLCEISCRAFSLHTPPLSKIYTHSTPCILIGYAPHSKAYRLWDPVSSKVYNSFHIIFTEHLDTVPSSFQLGTVLSTTNATSPPSWDAPSPIPPEKPSTNDRPFSSIPDEHPSFLPFNNADPSTIVTYNNTLPPNNNNSNNTITSSNNTVNPSNNTVTSSNNTVPPQTNNTIPPQANNTVPPQTNNTVPPQTNNTIPPQTNNTIPPQTNNTDPPPPTVATNTAQPPLTITIPPRLSLRRSACIRALNQSDDHTAAFLAKYSTVRDTHDLLPTDIIFENDSASIDDILSALSDSSLEPTSADDNDEPTWAQAMASDEREYWIAGGRDELKSLEDLKVFVLVPRSELPRGQCPLKGKLICKRKLNDTGHIVQYKVRYMAKGFAQCYGVDYNKATAPTVRLKSF